MTSHATMLREIAEHMEDLERVRNHALSLTALIFEETGTKEDLASAARVLAERIRAADASTPVS